MRATNLIKKLCDRFAFGNKNLLLSIRKKTLKPKWIWFEVTDNCNSRCRHCHIWQKNPTKNQLTFKELENIFKDPLFSEVETIINSGGEPILRNDIVDIIKLEHRLFPKASLDLSTNGLMAERVLGVVQSILAENIKINVGVSLDAIGKKHDEIRGVPGNFEKVNYLLRKLVELRNKYPEKLSMVIGLTLSQHTLGEWEKVKNYADNLKIELMAQWYNQSSFYDNQGNRRENIDDKMISAVKKQPNTLIREKWLKLLNNKPFKFKCFAGESFFALRCDGNVAPCLNFWDQSLGNLREQSLTEIWQNPRAEAIRKKVKNCSGCLNSWGVEWSASAIFYPRLFFYLRNPKALLERLKR